MSSSFACRSIDVMDKCFKLDLLLPDFFDGGLFDGGIDAISVNLSLFPAAALLAPLV